MYKPGDALAMNGDTDACAGLKRSFEPPCMELGEAQHRPVVRMGGKGVSRWENNETWARSNLIAALMSAFDSIPLCKDKVHFSMTMALREKRSTINSVIMK